jgi:mRNA interferase YafQ
MKPWTVQFRPRFKHEVAALRDLRGKHFDLDAFLLAVKLLGDGETLPEGFRDHKLDADWHGRREFHLAGDDLIIYQRKPRAREIVFLRAGTHNQLFRQRRRKGQ